MTAHRIRHARRAVAGLLLLGLLAGCSRDETTPGSSPAPSGTATSPLAGVVPQRSAAEDRTLWEASRRAIKECMKARGIDFTFPAWEVGHGKEQRQESLLAAAARPASAFGNPDWAKHHGYGIDAKALDEAESERLGPETSEALDGATQEALYGGKNDPEEVLDLGPSEGKLSWSKNACYTIAQTVIYGDYKELQKLTYAVNAISKAMELKVRADPAVVSALDKWRTCMSERGWPGLQQQGDAYEKVLAAFRAHRKDAADLESSIAPADAECTVQAGYAGARRSAEQRTADETRATMSGTILAFIDLQRRALAKANEILSS